MENEIESIRNSTYTLVRDYSIWDEGFAAVVNDDREWLYSSIGSSVTELDTFDLAILVPDAGTNFGWVAGSPPEGEADILPAPLLAAILGLLEHLGAGVTAQRAPLLAEFDGAPWYLRGRADDARRGHPAGDAARIAAGPDPRDAADAGTAGRDRPRSPRN